MSPPSLGDVFVYCNFATSAVKQGQKTREPQKQQQQEEQQQQQERERDGSAGGAGRAGGLADD